MAETTPQVSTIITPPPNEPQNDHSAQLDDSLSKLFGSDPEIKQEFAEPEKETGDKPEQSKNIVESNQPSPADDKPIEEKVDEEFKTKPSKEGWKILRDSHSKAKKTILEKDQELANLKKSLAEKGQTTSQEAENLKKEIEELKSYRAMVDIQADPEFLQKYDEPINKKTEVIANMLKEWGVASEIIQKIDYTDPGLLDRIADTIGENKDKISAKKFLRNAEEINELYDKRSESLEEYRKNYKTLLETKKKETFTRQAESEGRTQKRLEAIAQMKDEKGETQFPFLQEKIAKDPSNAAEVEQVQNHNKAVEYLKGKLDMALKAETPEDRADLAVAAVAAHWTNAQLRAAMKKIESLQTELGKISKVSSSTPKSQRTTVNHNVGNDNLDLDSSLASFMGAQR